MAHTKYFLILSFISFKFGLVSANITTTQFLRDSQELVSKNSAFKFGFFSPANSTTRYAGIWYNQNVSGFHRVVWMANRDNPLNDSSGVLRISEDGDLQLLNGQNNTVWSSNVTANNEVNDSIAQLLDTGNLVVLSNASGNIIWQSFDHLTDVWLPGMELSFDENTNIRKQLVSWKSALDPASGRFTAGIQHIILFEVFIWDGDRPYWRSGPWNGNVFIGIPVMYNELVEAGGFIYDNSKEGRIDLSFPSPNETFVDYYALTFDGKMVHTVWDDQNGQWSDVWQSMDSECDVYGKCGEFGSCYPNNSRICGCLRGFEPRNYQEWSEGNWSSGCVRRTPLQCGIVGSKEDGFFNLTNVKVPDNPLSSQTVDEEHCKSQCLANCSCLAYAVYLRTGCMTWSGSLIDIQEFSSVGNLGVVLFIRLAGSELDVETSSRWKMILAISLSLGSLAFVVVIFCLWRWRSQRSGWKGANSKDRSSVNISDVKLQDLPLLKFVELAAATNNFDNYNKLGQGGFGPVFKGILEGQEIAVKRLSRASGQGLQEFMNEVDVISKLQHRNLVRLLGCCAEGEEKMLVYEFMPNKSLDAFLFDPILQKLLDWKKRLNIIEGISRGLLYLHRDSRLRIVHRDLKASNILLDENLNAKISDFGMARIFGSNEDQGNTNRVVGTYGYMSPEYAMEGRFSEKSDVYSFGVLLLEIVSGRKNTRFNVDEPFSLIKYAWQLRKEGNCVSLIDPTINDPCFQEEILRCVEMGLLCVQELPEERPPFSTIVSMIDREITDLPQPMEPAFTQSENFYPRIPQASEFDQRYCSVNDVSLISLISGR